MTDTLSPAEEYAVTIAEEIQGLAYGRLDGFTPDTEDPFEMVQAVTREWCATLALDAELTYSLAGELVAVEVLRTTGGPACSVTFRERGDVTVRAWQGSDTAELHSSAMQTVGVALEVLAEFGATLTVARA